jgi:hypothetical protein
VNGLNQYNAINTPECAPAQLTLRERLERNKTSAMERLESVNAALKLLDEHPELEAFHDAITKVGY